MKTIPYLAKEMQRVLYRRANEVAWETGFMKRERVLTGSSFVVGLVSAWQANPEMSLAGISQAIGNAGTPLSRQALDQRFSQADGERELAGGDVGWCGASRHRVTFQSD